MAWRTDSSVIAPGRYYLSGADAIVEGAVAARCGYFAGYPITPTTEVLERIAVRFPEVGASFMQMEDEIASVCSCIGASWAGVKSMTVTSGPGFSLMQEGIGHAVMTEAPMVVVDGQRAGPSTGQVTVGAGDVMQARWGMHGGIPTIALAPWSVQELYDGTIHAFNLAEQYRLPVLVMAEAATTHLNEVLEIGPEVNLFDRDKKPGAPPFGCDTSDGVPPMPSFGEGEKLLVTASTHDARGFRRTADPATERTLTTRLYNKIMLHESDISEVESYYMDDAEVAVVAYGFTARSALSAVEQLRREGMKAGMVRLKTLWPFPSQAIGEVGRQVKLIVVPEMNLGQMVYPVTAAVSCRVAQYNQMDGMVIYPSAIVETVRRAAQ
ncbi:MAG: 2-oxoacid:acceptor oxidoreductase subunit alpha [Dehalococcoidia bacterium]|nr:2-oxoacid:acceptor oxidoreductase subunit alpha [Dehalococcoidia bacterium]